jgi:predicted nuclease with RNAse H fold
MSKIIGLDLAGLEKNETGFCVFQEKNAVVRVLHSDDEILAAIDAEQPDLICIDGPLTIPREGNLRRCDLELQDYGVLPPLLGGMRYLTLRANRLRERLERRYRVIEVFPTASAKILGFWDPNPAQRQKALVRMGITGDVEKRMLTKDEVDAIVAAATGHLYLSGKAAEVGGDEGIIVVPRV